MSVTNFDSIALSGSVLTPVVAGSKAFAAADITGTVTTFTITGGPIRVLKLGFHITTALPSGANTLKFQHTPTSGSATDLCGATDTASAAKMAIFNVNGTKATGLVKNTDTGIIAAGQADSMPIVLSPGVISSVFSGGPPATGAAIAFILYEPLTAASVVA